MGLKDVDDEPTFNDKFFPRVKQVSYHEINQTVFGCRFIKRTRPLDEGINMSGLAFKRRVYLFVLCIILFPNLLQCQPPGT